MFSVLVVMPSLSFLVLILCHFFLAFLTEICLFYWFFFPQRIISLFHSFHFYLVFIISYFLFALDLFCSFLGYWGKNLDYWFGTPFFSNIVLFLVLFFFQHCFNCIPQILICSIFIYFQFNVFLKVPFKHPLDPWFI